MRRIEEFWIEFNPPETEEEIKVSGFTSFCFDIIDSVKGAVIVVFLIFALIFKAVGVDGDSMVPTLIDGDWVAVSGITMSVDRGDIVVITQPWERNVPIIKRIIAVGGDTVDIDFDTSDHNMPWAHPTGAHKHIFDFSKKNPHSQPLQLTDEELAEKHM